MPEDAVLHADHIDYMNLLTGVLNQALDDYVKLQHPSSRTKGSLQKFYLTAFDFLFDTEYRMLNLRNGFNEDMSLRDLISEVLGTERPDVGALQNYARKTCVKYWEDKKVAVFDRMPETVCVAGQTFNVENAPIKGYAIDWDTLTITLNWELEQLSQQNLLEAMVDIMLELRSIKNVGPRVRRMLAREMFWMLKVNNCFSFAGVPPQAELLAEDD